MLQSPYPHLLASCYCIFPQKGKKILPYDLTGLLKQLSLPDQVIPPMDVASLSSNSFLTHCERGQTQCFQPQFSHWSTMTMSTCLLWLHSACLPYTDTRDTPALARGGLCHLYHIMFILPPLATPPNSATHSLWQPFSPKLPQLIWAHSPCFSPLQWAKKQQQELAATGHTAASQEAEKNYLQSFLLLIPSRIPN